MVFPSQDIRKFFGPCSSIKPSKQALKSSASIKNTNKTKGAEKKDTGRQLKTRNSNKTLSSPSKKLVLDKSLQSEANDSIVVEDFSDEEVIKSSSDSTKKAKLGKEKVSSESKSSKPKKGKSSSTAKIIKGRVGDVQKSSADNEDVIDIDSIPSSSSSTTKSQTSIEKSKVKKSLSKSDSTLSVEECGKKKKPLRVESTPLRTSPRKKNSKVEEEKESRKRTVVGL